MGNFGDTQQERNPASEAVAITLSDTVNHAPFRAFYVGVTGDVKIDTPLGQTVTLKNCVQGSIVPIKAIRFYSTGTTATNLIGLR